ncbi:ATP-dependent Clp protease proteolytic subunit-related protein 2, chloroplastic [Hordeum vulgare]|nr:ATP-dependent Clp protease proteolytic subunit-related protein 2, chloroplastic [Hordeum vulgare]
MCRTAPANSSCFHPRAVASSPSSLSVGTKVFVGVKAQTRLAGSSESSCPNVNARFYTAVNRRVSLGYVYVRERRPLCTASRFACCIDIVWCGDAHTPGVCSDPILETFSFLCFVMILQLTPCMALYDTMLSLKSPFGTHCLGFAFNLAGFILAAGQKGSRTGMPLCRVSLQSPAIAARGQVWALAESYWLTI